MSDYNENDVIGESAQMSSDLTDEQTQADTTNQVPEPVEVASTPVAELQPQSKLENEPELQPQFESQPDNATLLEQIRMERALLEKERITIAAEREQLNIRRREEIESSHLTNVSTFFWLHYLFNMRFIGFICSIIFSFAGTNISRKNYARARLIWHLIRILCIVVIVLGIILLVKYLPGSITDYVPDSITSKISDLL